MSQSEAPLAKSSSHTEPNALAKRPFFKTPKGVAILIATIIVVVSLLFVFFPRYGSLTITIHSASSQGMYALFVNGREWSSGSIEAGISRMIHADLVWRGEECQVMIVELASTNTITRTQSQTTVVCSGVDRSIYFEFP